MYIRRLDEKLMANSLIWLSKHVAVSPDVYKRLLVLVNELSLTINESADTLVSVIQTEVPWREIFHALGAVYQSFVETRGVSEDEYAEFARQSHCMSQGHLRWTLDSISGSADVHIDSSNPIFPIRLLHVWTGLLSSDTSEESRKERFSKEFGLWEAISKVLSSPKIILETWYEFLSEEANRCQTDEGKLVDREATDREPKARQRILHRFLGGLRGENVEKGLEATMFLVSTGCLPWDPTVQFDGGKISCPSNPLVRRLRTIDWVDRLSEHPLMETILEYLGGFKTWSSRSILLIENKLTNEEETELKQMGLADLSRWTRSEEMLYSALIVFNRILASTEGQKRSRSKRVMEDWMVTILCEDLRRSGISFDLEYLNDKYGSSALQDLSNPVLRLIAYATLGIQWSEEWTPKILEAKSSLNDRTWRSVSRVCFRHPPFIASKFPSLWQLRLRFWIHFDSYTTSSYLHDMIKDLTRLKNVEEEIQSSRLGVDHGGDFLLALFHLNNADGWNPVHSFIPNLLTGNTVSSSDLKVPSDVITHLSSICYKVSGNPARLIRLLIELIRADINQNPDDRRPQIFFNLLKHAKIHLSGKELRRFSPSCRRLIHYIKESCKQFEEAWDKVVNSTYSYVDPRPHYKMVNKRALKVVTKEVITILEPIGTWDGECQDVSWPRYLLRQTGTKKRPFVEDVSERITNGNDEQDQQYQPKGKVEWGMRDEARVGDEVMSMLTTETTE